MYYGIYKNIRNSAWQCLADFGVDSLPVNVSKIARDAGVHIIKNSVINKLTPRESGRSYCEGNTWYLIYDDLNDPVIARFTIAHELGHFFLGHEKAHMRYEGMEDNSKKPKFEQQADMFALRLLCPACIIWEMKLTTPELIAEYCRVPLYWAKIRHDRMKELCQKNKFLSNPLEKKVYDNFSDYFEKNKKTLL